HGCSSCAASVMPSSGRKAIVCCCSAEPAPESRASGRPRGCVGTKSQGKLPERQDAAALSLGAELAQLLQRAPVTCGRFIPDLLQAITEVDDGSQDFISLE